MSVNKLGLFGGTFDPFHFGHLNSMASIAEAFELDEVRAIPAFVSPLRVQTQGSTSEHRVAMLQAGIAGHEDLIKVDTREIERGGTSYTIDTVKSFEKDGTTLFLIIGMDQFAKFDQWKDYAQILDRVNLVVTSRPGTELPYSPEDWPAGVRSLVADFDVHEAILKNGRSIYFVHLADVEVSSSEVRKKIRLGQDVQTLVPGPVEEYVRAHHLYESVQQTIGDFEKFTKFCEDVLNEKGGINVKSYDLRAKQAPSEFTLIASGTSTRHATALADHLTKEVKRQYGCWPESIEGQGEGRWIVVDYGALIVHTFYDYVRQEYRLEQLWTK